MKGRRKEIKCKLTESQGYYATPECRYVAQNSGQTKYSFTVNLDSCGTQFINDFAGDAGQAYLENVLVLQVTMC